MRVSVVGGGTCSDAVASQARDVGGLLGERGHELVCGGRGGVMAAACEGSRSAGGHTIGILPGEDRAAANDHVETAIATGLGDGRNALVVLNGDAVIALAGGPGTLSEIGLARVHGHPVAGLGTHRIEDLGVERVESPEAAVEYVEGAVE